jgi:phosphatidylinositol-3-phosphatase
MVGGSDSGITDDGSYVTNRVAAPSLARESEARGLSWKSYSQSLPFAGFAGTCYPCNSTDPSSPYASTHNGFLNFAGVQDNPAEMQPSVPIEQLNASDLVDSIMSSAAWRDGLNAIVITWDEGTDVAGCCDADPGGGQIYTSVVTNHGPRGLT